LQLTRLANPRYEVVWVVFLSAATRFAEYLPRERILHFPSFQKRGFPSKGGLLTERGAYFAGTFQALFIRLCEVAKPEISPQLWD